MKKIRIPLLLLSIMWFVFIFFGKNAIIFGLWPRHLEGLKGIFYMPFIHASWSHIISNTIPIFLLSWLMAVFYERFWLFAWFAITITGGIILWFIGRDAYHVGASLTIFGLIGFFLGSAFFRKELKVALIAIVVGILYGGALYGIIPSDPHISWEGHLSGFVAGILWSYLLRNVDRNDESEITM